MIRDSGISRADSLLNDKGQGRGARARVSHLPQVKQQKQDLDPGLLTSIDGISLFLTEPSGEPFRRLSYTWEGRMLWKVILAHRFTSRLPSFGWLTPLPSLGALLCRDSVHLWLAPLAQCLAPQRFLLLNCLQGKGKWFQGWHVLLLASPHLSPVTFFRGETCGSKWPVAP